MEGRIVIVTGAPATGKSTVCALMAKHSSLPRSIHLHTDDLYRSLSKGAIPPYLPEADKQNRTVIEAFLEAAKRFARDGYDVLVDGVVGPWFLEPWIEAAEQHYEIHYLVLRASKGTTLQRALGRDKLDEETNRRLVETMWKQFSNLGCFERYVISTDDRTTAETVAILQEKLENQSNLLLPLPDQKI